jgi:hypothetical protein
MPVNWFLVGVASLCILCLPGWAYMSWVESGSGSPWEWLADGVGISIALTVLAGQVCFWLGVAPGGWGLGLFYGLSLFIALAAGLNRRFFRFRRSDWPLWLGGAMVLGGLLVFRFLQISPLAFPNWVDSVHHSLIVRKMLEYGGLPSDLSPYLDAPFSYHYGFHLLAAILAGLARLRPDQAVLWLGQIIGALVSLSVYRLARSLRQSQRVSLLAGLLPGFIFYMPGYYLSWGRYPLLSGLVLLPLAMAAVMDLLRDLHSLPAALRLALLTAGLCLTHYLALLLFILFLAILAVERLAAVLAARDWRRSAWQVGVAALVGVTASLPWLGRMLTLNAAMIQVGEPRLTLNVVDFNGLLSMLRPDYDLMLMAVAAFCLILALFRSEMRRIALWGAILLFFAMPFAPQPGPFRSDLFAIVLFLPAALVLAWGVSGGANGLAALLTLGWPDPRRLKTWLSHGFFGVAVLLLLVLGITQTRKLINSGTIIADAADRRALEWVDNNTPLDARFYINSTIWSWNIYRGVDGGYWLMPFAGRFSLVPPSVYTWMSPQNAAQIEDWAKRSAKLTGCTPEFWDIVREANLSYVYVRAGKGSLQPGPLESCPRLQRVYNLDGIAIFHILNP